MARWYEGHIYTGVPLSSQEKKIRNAKLKTLVDRELSKMNAGDTFSSEWFAMTLKEDLIRDFDSYQHLLKTISATLRHAVGRGEFSGSNGNYTKNKNITPPSRRISQKKRTDYMVALIDHCLCHNIYKVDDIQALVHKNIQSAYPSAKALRHAITEIRSRVVTGDVGADREVKFAPVKIDKSLVNQIIKEFENLEKIKMKTHRETPATSDQEDPDLQI